jgi:ATP-dependent DNA helicase RecQ
MFACAEDLIPLQNFAYGDTPTRQNLHALLTELFSLGKEFDLSIYDLSSRHDMRQTVLRTALTYLELKGLLRQGTPFYGGYQIRPFISEHAVADAFQGEYRVFVQRLFELSKRGKTWFTLDAQEVAIRMKQPRTRVVRAIEVMEERGLVELKAAELRHRFSCIAEMPDLNTLADQLMQRFEYREANEIRRLRNVVQLVNFNGCQVNALAHYFGEERSGPCGHCSHCQRGHPQKMPEPPTQGGAPSESAWNTVRQLQDEHPGAVDYPRQVARFFCGISSPATSRARITRHELFGKYNQQPFALIVKSAGERIAVDGAIVR